MKSDFIEFVFYLIAVVVGGACEECLPKPFGVGVPVLLLMSMSVAARKPVLVMIPFAIMAGAFEDALSDLPMMTSVCFFFFLAILVHRLHVRWIGYAVAYPLYEVWLAVVVPHLSNGVFVRTLLAVPIAVLTALVVCSGLAFIERKAAIGEA